MTVSSNAVAWLMFLALVAGTVTAVAHDYGGAHDGAVQAGSHV